MTKETTATTLDATLPSLVTINQAAQQTGLSPIVIHDEVYAGRMPASATIGDSRTIWLHPADVTAMVARVNAEGTK